MKTKQQYTDEITQQVISKASQRKIAVDDYAVSWIVNTLLSDIECGYSDGRIYRHMNSMLTRVKTEVRD